MLMIGQKELGGGFVRLSFTAAGKRLKAGEPLTVAQIEGFANRRRLIDAGFIAVYPPRPAVADDADIERHIVHLGRGQYDVIKGVRLNDAPVSKEEAEEIATRPEQ